MEEGRRHEQTDLPLKEVDGLRDAIGALSAASGEVLRRVARCAHLGIYRERGFRSMTDWLSTEFAVGQSTAREWVLLSRKLLELPRIAEAYESGRLTWEQLRPLARFAAAEDDAHWAEAARLLYPSQLWREKERRTRLRLKEEGEAHAARSLRLVWDRDDPVLNVYGRLGKEQGSALEEAIRARSREIPVDEHADDPSEARAADALVELCTSSGGTPKPVLVVHADVDSLSEAGPTSRAPLAETASGQRLDPETARRLGCDAEVEFHLEEQGRPVGIGRKSARVPGWLERAVRHRDGGSCRFPGCERRSVLVSHHVRHWADGGGTDLENLVTLCPTHHRYVHEDGWRIGRDPTGELRFHDPTGRARGSPAAA